LGRNIQCGNSLIGPDYFEGRLVVEEAERRRVNAFDWQRAFPAIFARGGFDAVIGNPPYIRIQAMKEWAPTEVEFYKKKYVSASKGNYDIYVVFVEKGLGLLNPKGKLGFILPHKFFTAKYGEPLLDMLSRGKYIFDCIPFGDQQVFENATTYTCLLFLTRKGGNEFIPRQTVNLDEFIRTKGASVKESSISRALYVTWNVTSNPELDLKNKFKNYPIKLSNIAFRIFQGIITGSDQVFLLKNLEGNFYQSKTNGKTYEIECELMHPLCKGSVNIKRYYITDLEKSVLFPYKISEHKATLFSRIEMINEFPLAWKYLNENRQLLESREHGKWKNSYWYSFSRNQNLAEMEQTKILTPSIANHSSYTLDMADHYYFVGSGGGGGGGYGVTLFPNELMKYEYLLGLLNSKCLDFYLKLISSPFSGGYFAFNKQYIEQLPIRVIDFGNPADVKRHDRMVALVQRMLDLHKQTPATPFEQERLARDISATDAEIDRLVYELYELTPEEIKIVEG